MKQHLKGNIYIDYNNGFITTHQLLVKGDDAKNAGEEYYSNALTYLKPEVAVKAIKKHHDIDVLASDVLAAYERAKRKHLIEGAKAAAEMKTAKQQA